MRARLPAPGVTARLTAAGRRLIAAGTVGQAQANAADQQSDARPRGSGGHFGAVRDRGMRRRCDNRNVWRTGDLQDNQQRRKEAADRHPKAPKPSPTRQESPQAERIRLS